MLRTRSRLHVVFFAATQGRRVVVVCNLKPANMRGVQSQAMVLAATSTDGAKVGEAMQGAPRVQKYDNVHQLDICGKVLIPSLLQGAYPGLGSGKKLSVACTTLTSCGCESRRRSLSTHDVVSPITCTAVLLGPCCPMQVELVEPPAGVPLGERVTFQDLSGEPEEVLNPKKRIFEQVRHSGLARGEGRRILT